MAETKSKTTQPTPKDRVAEAVQDQVDAAEARGYLGVAVDPTPNENYTLAGVTAGKRTPESDPEYAREVRQQLDDAARTR
ncbi:MULTISPECIES: hypothetical protein [unclassified Streptomyces]|uniref:hypothetical protein n=1 Tax=unclassified Streptomyces TaxID=2593676 RepID=UPI00081F0998|nr:MULTISPECIES: hypothetical protein [unclassified Streptomyces]MYR29803.1 hypothetical protein [Streptomyces sp. SID4945]SCF47704.1 hypothetical protein GA0115257_119112 [Streptomyces sp. LcepLS]